MLRYIREYRFYITLFLFLLIPVIAVDTAQRQPRDYRFYDKVIVFVTSPVQRTITWALDELTGLFQNYFFLLHTQQENSRLLEENRNLVQVISKLRETEQENSRLRAQLEFRELFKLKTVVARVVSRDVSPDFRMIRINRGENAGIKKDMAVVTQEGVVGRVLRVAPTHADVVTILDLLSAVDAIDSRSRAPGVVEGKTDQIMQLRYVLRTDDIQVGDTLVSSGLTGHFPKGVAVGVVTRVEKKQFGISQYVEVKPTVQFAKLEEVQVITEFSAEFDPSPIAAVTPTTLPTTPPQ